MKILITGAVGFIGFHLSQNLLNFKKIKYMELIILINITQLNLKKKNRAFKKKKFSFSKNRYYIY